MTDYRKLLKSFIKALMIETGNSHITKALYSLTREEGIELVRILDEIDK